MSIHTYMYINTICVDTHSLLLSLSLSLSPPLSLSPSLSLPPFFFLPSCPVVVILAYENKSSFKLQPIVWKIIISRPIYLFLKGLLMQLAYCIFNFTFRRERELVSPKTKHFSKQATVCLSCHTKYKLKFVFILALNNTIALQSLLVFLMINFQFTLWIIRNLSRICITIKLFFFFDK